ERVLQEVVAATAASVAMLAVTDVDGTPLLRVRVGEPSADEQDGLIETTRVAGQHRFVLTVVPPPRQSLTRMAQPFVEAVMDLLVATTRTGRRTEDPAERRAVAEAPDAP